ncbi:MAG: hypothetical protein R2761_01055 [Acidimicrobiales bacterium]
MPRVRQSSLRHDDDWPVLAGNEAEGASELGAAAHAMPLFFVAWMTIGTLLALVLVARGHDARTMIGLGLGLGPLMAVVASDTIRRRERRAAPLVLKPGDDLGGPVDVLIVVQGHPDGVVSVRPNLEAAVPSLGTLVLARPVAYEWADGSPDEPVVREEHRALVEAADRLGVFGAELVLWPGPVDVVVERFRRRHPSGLVLVTMADPGNGAATAG